MWRGERVYSAGDTDRKPKMTNTRCDIALLPVGGKCTMTVEEAAQAATDIRPQVAAPMHRGAGVIGTHAEAGRHGILCEGIVQMLDSGQPRSSPHPRSKRRAV